MCVQIQKNAGNISDNDTFIGEMQELTGLLFSQNKAVRV